MKWRQRPRPRVFIPALWWKEVWAGEKGLKKTGVYFHSE
jgi:hypothetical protein